MFDILEEERKRLINLRQRYADELEELPKGSLSYKKRWNKEYVYLAYRKSGTVKFDYVGRADSHAVRPYIQPAALKAASLPILDIFVMYSREFGHERG